ncbi:hypothetical protein ACOSP7_016772 [Xanthoceras sorbifolium]
MKCYMKEVLLSDSDEEDEVDYINDILDTDSDSEFVIVQKWYSKVTIVVSKAFIFEEEALIDSGADLNCISEGIIASQYVSKTTQMLNTANGGRMLIEYKLSGAAKKLEESVCSDVPNAFWSRQKHTVCLPYVNGFDERRVSTKARPI